MYPQKSTFNSRRKAPPAWTADLLGAIDAKTPNIWPQVKLNEKKSAKYCKRDEGNQNQGQQ